MGRMIELGDGLPFASFSFVESNGRPANCGAGPAVPVFRRSAPSPAPPEARRPTARSRTIQRALVPVSTGLGKREQMCTLVPQAARQVVPPRVTAANT
jgi:hypothetical protein